MSFEEKVVVITGAIASIGSAIAVKFAEQKAKIVLVARNETRLKEVGEKCQVHGSKPLMIVADVSKDADVKKIVNTTISQYGKIDVLVNNAGVVGKSAIYDANAVEVYDRIMANNLRSAVYLTDLMAPHLIKSNGNIINISSIAAVDTISTEQFAYCASKAGMDHFTRTVALDLAPKGVRVNTVSSGPVPTAIVDNFGIGKDDYDAFWKSWEERSALERESVPEKIDELVLFLASDKASAITGSSYFSDKGVLLKRKHV